MINLAYKRRTWSVSQNAQQVGHTDGTGNPPRTSGSSDRKSEYLSQNSSPPADRRRGSHRRNKSDSHVRGRAAAGTPAQLRPRAMPGKMGMHNTGSNSNPSTRTGKLGSGSSGGSPRKLQFVHARKDTVDNFSLDGGSQYSIENGLPKTVGERFVEIFFHLLLNSLPFLDDNWRAQRDLKRCEILWNFWIAICGLMGITGGTTIIGLALVGQEPVLALASTYDEYQCYVSGGDVVQYSMEGYVESHWMPLKVSVLNVSQTITNSQTSSSFTHATMANVTGVSGGWVYLDRFPMPPVHGRITDVPESESFYSNNVGMAESVARSWVNNHTGRVFPCLVPSNLRPVTEEDRNADSCSPAGLYPFEWALEDLLTKGVFKNDETCAVRPGIVNRVLVPNADDRGAEAEHKSNYGSHFACRGRIVFVNATFDREVQPITQVYYYFLTAGICLVAAWPIVCIVGRIHGICWTWRDERVTKELGKADRAKRNKWRAAMERSAKKGLESEHAVAFEGFITGVEEETPSL